MSAPTPERDDLRAALDRVKALADEWDRVHLTGFCADGCDRLAHGNRDRFVADLYAAVEGGWS